jgi:hypothetical protein
VLGEDGMTAASIDTDGAVTIDKAEGGFAITAPHLTVRVSVPGADAAVVRPVSTPRAGTQSGAVARREHGARPGWSASPPVPPGARRAGLCPWAPRAARHRRAAQACGRRP